MTLSPTDYLRVSYSSLNTFAECARKFEFRKLYPRSSHREEGFAAEVGKALHAGYQDYLSYRDSDRALWELLKAYPYELEYMTEKSEDRSLEAAMSTLEAMIAYQPMDEWDLLNIRRPNTSLEISQGLTEGVVVPAIEVPFELRFTDVILPDGRGVAMTGYIDAAMQHRIRRTTASMDIKTHRRFGADAEGKYRYDSQQTPYSMVIEHIQGSVLEELEIFYLDCFVDLAEPRIQLYPYKRDRIDLQEFLMTKVMQFQAIQRYMELDFFPRKDGGCMAWNKPCWYLEVCQTREREAAEHWILRGEEPTEEPEWFPWVVTELEVFGNGG